MLLSKLPFINITELENAKFLIDTGSSMSIISEDLAKRYFKDYIYYEPFIAKTMHGESIQNYRIKIPSLRIFKDPNPKNEYVFNIINFSDNS